MTINDKEPNELKIRRVRHRKRGTTYRVIGEGETQVAVNKVYGEELATRIIRDGTKLIVYQCEADGKIWLRPTDEFMDGRFEELDGAEGEEK